MIYVYRALVIVFFFFTVAAVLAVFHWATRSEELRSEWTFKDIFDDLLDVLVDGDKSQYARAKADVAGEDNE